MPVRAPAGAPNILLFMGDDVGFAMSSAFGGPVPTPHMERLAAIGQRYNRFNTTAICSPSRAALLTGRNHHRVGVGFLADQPSDFPGYDMHIPSSAATIAETHWSLKSDRNFSNDAAVARNMEAAARTIDPNERKRLYSEALRRIADQAYWIPLYTYSQNYLVSKDLAYPVPKDGLPRLFRAHWRAGKSSSAKAS